MPPNPVAETSFHYGSGKKLEIVSGAAPPPFRILAGDFLAATGGEMRSD